MNLDLAKLTLQQTATLLCLSTRQVQNLVGKGVIVKRGQGRKARYVWSEVFDGYLADRLAQLGNGNRKQDAEDLNAAELRRTNADARLKELKADELEGRLVEVAYVERSQAQINANVRARLLAMPAKLTPQLVSVESPARVKAIIEKETHQTCEELVKIASKVPKVEDLDEGANE